MKLVRPFLVLAALLWPVLTAPAVRAESGRSRESGTAQSVLAEVNRMRTDPAGYAQTLAGMRACYSADGMLRRPGELPYRTHEGEAALEDAIRFLRSTQPILPLASCDGLTESACAFAAEQAGSGGIGHGGRGGSNPFGRMSRWGTWRGGAGENIMYGSPTAARIVYDLLLDDGLRGRPHRANLFNPDFRVVGIGVDRHPKYRHVCVMDFAVAFDPR